MKDSDTDADFLPFRSFDRSECPTSAFQRALDRRVQDARSRNGSASISSLAPAQPPSSSFPSAVPLTSRLRRWQPLRSSILVAAAVLLVVAVIAGAFVWNQPPDAIRLSFQPYETEVGAVNFAGTPGRTWQMSDTNPILGSTVLEVGAEYLRGLSTPLVVDTSVYLVIDQIEFDGPQLIRYDLFSGEEIWRVGLSVSGILASDGHRLFALDVPDQTARFQSQLIAIDITSGDVAWRGPLLANRLILPGSLAVTDGAVVATDFLGNTVSVDAQTGAQQWQSPAQFLESKSDAFVVREDSQFGIPALVVVGDSVFVVRPSLDVVQLDRASGAQQGVIETRDQYVHDATSVSLAATGETLLMMVLRGWQEPTYEGGTQYLPGEIVSFDISTLDARWQRPVSNPRGNVALSDGTLYLAEAAYDPAISGSDSYNYTRIVPIDLETMRSGALITGVGMEGDLQLSIAGQTLMVVTSDGSLVFIDLSTEREISRIDLPVDGWMVNVSQPAGMYGNLPLVSLADGRFILAGPSTHMPATPTASRASRRGRHRNDQGRTSTLVGGQFNSQGEH